MKIIILITLVWILAMLVTWRKIVHSTREASIAKGYAPEKHSPIDNLLVMILVVFESLDMVAAVTICTLETFVYLVLVIFVLCM